MLGADETLCTIVNSINGLSDYGLVCDTVWKPRKSLFYLRYLSFVSGRSINRIRLLSFYRYIPSILWPSGRITIRYDHWKHVFQARNISLYDPFWLSFLTVESFTKCLSWARHLTLFYLNSLNPNVVIVTAISRFIKRRVLWQCAVNQF